MEIGKQKIQHAKIKIIYLLMKYVHAAHKNVSINKLSENIKTRFYFRCTKNICKKFIL